MALMTEPGGRRRAAPRAPARPPHFPGRLLALTVGAIAAGLAWVFLVRAAIDFGTIARDGEPVAWVLTVLAGLGAAACLMAAIGFVTRVLVLLGWVDETPHPHRRGGLRRR